MARSPGFGRQEEWPYRHLLTILVSEEIAQRHRGARPLSDDLCAAFGAGRLAEALTTYTHPNVLVVDEVGYLTYGADAANMLFHFVNDRHRRKRAMIFTTNKPVNAWGHVHPWGGPACGKAHSKQRRRGKATAGRCGPLPAGASAETARRGRETS